MISDRSLVSILNALPVFHSAARLGSFTKAGADLGMAQPSVSRFVGILENHIGARLFERRHNRIMLTAEGERLYEATTLGLGHIQTVIAEIRQLPVSNTVTIGCTHGFAHMWVLPRIGALQSLMPGKKIQITTSDHVAQYSTNDVDLAVRFGGGDWPGVEAHLLFDEEVFPVCSPEFAARHGLKGRDVEPGGLLDLPLLHQDQGENGWLCWRSWLAHFGIGFEAPQDIYNVYNYAFILQAAMEGDGIALAWRNLAEPYLINGWLVEMGSARARTGKGYYLVFAPGNQVAEAARIWAKSAL